MSEPQVTIIVSPRERFSYTRQSLESIYQHTKIPFKLIYIDGNSPGHINRYLKAQAKQKNLVQLRTNYYLAPNHARNLGLAYADTKYLVFIDNDVIVSPGWLSHLVQCAEATNATVVGPLMCQNEPVHETVHFAGGESHIYYDIKGRRRLREKMYLQGKKVAEVRDRLKRQPTELAEFHCVLVRTAIFEQIGKLDTGMLNTKEHLDFCLQVRAAGGTIYFEPNCLVTYVPGEALELTDIPYYMLRWSDAWVLESLKRLQAKWHLAEDSYFTSKYRGLGWRRRDTLIYPLIRTLNFGKMSHFWENILTRIDKRLNRYLTNRYAQKYLK
ncbi:MAG TPA: glycosyltransferase family 2 protein [Xenococcaceae cyanobacterium]|jgi:GT2 family glycosyltransferase